jgi:hypothetical protein
MSEGASASWVSGELHDLLGLSHPTLVQYVLAKARRASSYKDLAADIAQEAGVPHTHKLDAFAETLWDKLGKRKDEKKIVVVEKKKKSKEKEKEYALLDDEDEEGDAQNEKNEEDEWDLSKVL